MIGQVFCVGFIVFVIYTFIYKECRVIQYFSIITESIKNISTDDPSCIIPNLNFNNDVIYFEYSYLHWKILKFRYKTRIQQIILNIL